MIAQMLYELSSHLSVATAINGWVATAEEMIANRENPAVHTGC